MAVKKISGDLFQSVPNTPRKQQQKKRRPKEIAVVHEDGCTGCEACIPFCPVDCIEQIAWDVYSDVANPPVQIRFDECIGCQICVRVCDALAWQTISMVSTDEFQEATGLDIGEAYPGKVEIKSLQQLDGKFDITSIYMSR